MSETQRPFEPATGPIDEQSVSGGRIPSAGSIRSSPPKKFSQRTGWRKVLTVCSDQHGLITSSQLYALGISPTTVSAYAATGLLRRVHRGVYALVDAPLTRMARYQAAVLASGPQASISYRCAAACHGLITHNYGPVDVTIPWQDRRRRDGIRIHRTTTLSPADVTVMDGLRLTSVPRTLFDLAEQVDDRRRLERALDEAVARGYQGITDDLEAQLVRNHKRHKPVRVWREILTVHRAGSAPTWNELEHRFLELVRRAGLPLPEVQATLDLGDGQPMIHPDFLWRRERVIVETDGYREHGKRLRFEHDRARDQRALAAGWVPFRVTWRQINDRPGDTITNLTRTITLRG